MRERPFWLENAVECWGAPAVEHNEPRQRKRPNPETGHNQVEGVREWHWANRDGTLTWGIETWDLGHRVRDRIVVVEAYGPRGSALVTRPGRHGDPYLGDVVLCLALAGIPVAHELLIGACAALAGDLGDLTAQWRDTSVSSTAIPNTEGSS